MSLEQDIQVLIMQIEQLAAENALLRQSVHVQSADSRGFEQFYEIGKRATEFGFMSFEDEQPLQGKILRHRYDFLS